MKTWFKAVPSSAGFLLWLAGSVSAQSSQPIQTNATTGLVLGTFLPSGHLYHSMAADDFVWTDSNAIVAVEWWGSYMEFGRRKDRTTPEAGPFEISFYAADSHPAPLGLPVASWPPLTSQVVRATETFAGYDQESSPLWVFPLTMLSLTNILQPSNLVQRLTPSHSDPLSQFLWLRFSLESQQVLTNTNSTLQQKTYVVLEELNAAIRGPCLYNADWFGTNLPCRTVTWLGSNWWLRATNLDGQTRIQFNRLLLEVAYRTLIASNRLFTVRDFPDLPEFIRRLTNHTDAVSAFLWNSPYADNIRTVLTNEAATTNEQLAALIMDLDEILRCEEQFYEAGRFASVALSVETRLWLGRNPEWGEDWIFLRRLLIEDAYPLELAKNRLAVYRFRAELPFPFQPQPGTTYWLAIDNATSNEAWLWRTTTNTHWNYLAIAHSHDGSWYHAPFQGFTNDLAFALWPATNALPPLAATNAAPPIATNGWQAGPGPFRQPIVTNANGVVSGRYFASGTAAGRDVADDFRMEDPSAEFIHLFLVRWWGTYIGEVAVRRTANFNAGPFHISIHAEDQNGWPHSISFTNYTVWASEALVSNDVNGEWVYRYEALLPAPFEAQPNTRYFLRIAKDTKEVWCWHTAPQTNAAGGSALVGRVPGGPWAPLNDQMAFEFESAREEFIPQTQADLTLLCGTSVIPLSLTGPTRVVLQQGDGTAGDNDNNGLEDIPTLMTELSLTGTLPDARTIHLSLTQPAPGRIEELANNVRARLEVRPFWTNGLARSRFDLGLQLKIGGDTNVYVAETNLVMEGIIDSVPPGTNAVYVQRATNTIWFTNSSGVRYGCALLHGEHRLPFPWILAHASTNSEATLVLQRGKSVWQTNQLQGASMVRSFTTANGNATDSDGDGREQIRAELARCDLSGQDKAGTPMHLALYPYPRRSPLGEFEESLNLQTNILDLPPFIPTGTADAFLDLLPQLTIGSQRYVVLTNIRLRALVHAFPAGSNDNLAASFSPPVLLRTLDGLPSDVSLVSLSYVPGPAQPDGQPGLTPSALAPLQITLLPSDQIQIIGPAEATGFILQSAPSLAAPVSWTDVPVPFTLVKGKPTVILDASQGARFFRVRPVQR